MSLEESLYSPAINDLGADSDFGGGGSYGSFMPRGASRNRMMAPASIRNPVGSAVCVRLFDIMFALAVLVSVAPALLLLIIVLKIDTPGPIFFIQQRVGRNGKFFPCFKLRTMVADAAERLEALLASSEEARIEWERDHKLKDDPRITALGRFVRKSSLDELPQLVNILIGHMSVVGPRPIVEAEIWRYGTYFVDYCSVRPGLTGLWQVSGRNHTTYDQRVALDRHYVLNKSLVFNLKIIARSIPVVLRARGAY